jgi:hypothetical protein
MLRWGTVSAYPDISEEAKNANRAAEEENPQQEKEGVSSERWSL